MKIFALFGGLLLLAATSAISSPDQPEVDLIVPQTLENQGIYGDAIKVFYSSPMNHDHTSTGSITDETIMAAERPQQPDFPGKNPAKNYHIKITPGPNSTTPAFEGTWASLGGRAKFDPYDPERKTIVLYFPESDPRKTRNVFLPGDEVEVTATPTIQDNQGHAMQTGNDKHKGKRKAS